MNRKEVYDTMVSEIVARLHERGGELRSRQVDEVIVEVAGLAADLYGRIERPEEDVRRLIEAHPKLAQTDVAESWRGE